MYYIYFPFVAVLSFLMFYECKTKNHPQWWALMVLFSPVTTPYFIFKSRKESGIILMMIFLSSFSAVAGIELLLYSRYRDVNQYTHLPPVTQQMIALSNTLRQSTIDLDTALVKLENLSKVESRIHEISNTVKFIGKLRTIMEANNKAINDLVQYTKDHNDFFAKQDLVWVFNIQKYYNNHNVIQHYNSLGKYLDSFEELLRYTYENFYNITELKDSEHLKNYDEYYIRYRRAVDSHNRFNVKRIDFQNQYLKKYPDIKAYLPGERQTETFRLWE
ncbi:MAG: hypothetical protein ABIJ31_05940 [Pseudomonadota bacterium]